MVELVIRITCKHCGKTGRPSMFEEFERSEYVCGHCGSVSDLMKPYNLLRSKRRPGFVYPESFRKKVKQERQDNESIR